MDFLAAVKKKIIGSNNMRYFKSELPGGSLQVVIKVFNVPKLLTRLSILVVSTEYVIWWRNLTKTQIANGVEKKGNRCNADRLEREWVVQFKVRFISSLRKGKERKGQSEFLEACLIMSTVAPFRMVLACLLVLQCLFVSCWNETQRMKTMRWRWGGWLMVAFELIEG